MVDSVDIEFRSVLTQLTGNETPSLLSHRGMINFEYFCEFKNNIEITQNPYSLAFVVKGTVQRDLRGVKSGIN